MKKFFKGLVTIIIILIVIIIIALAIRGKNKNNSTEELEAQVTELKEQNVKLMKEIADLQNRVLSIERGEDVVTVLESDEDEESKAEVNEGVNEEISEEVSEEEVLQKILSNDAKAVDYNSALEVVNNEDATEQMLLQITKNCLMEDRQLNSRSSAQKLASIITEHPQVSLQILNVMADSELQEVRTAALEKINKMMGDNQ